ncbi:hypothetical protein PENSPDRAFT_751038 [Peniophora sp. CONT]|nr:hypothetical protein PENSPDRAFT_751038 [Peniophora sp. CONT]
MDGFIQLQLLVVDIAERLPASDDVVAQPVSTDSVDTSAPPMARLKQTAPSSAIGDTATPLAVTPVKPSDTFSLPPSPHYLPCVTLFPPCLASPHLSG